MKKKSVKLVLAGFVLLLGIAALAHSNFFYRSNNSASFRHEMLLQILLSGDGNKEMRGELMTYIDQNIYPVLKKERADFETRLTQEEKQMLAAVRSGLAAKRQEILEMIRQVHEKTKKLSPEEKQQVQAYHEALMKQVAPAAEIGKKYAAEIRRSLDQQEGEWEKGLHAILVKWNAVPVYEQSQQETGWAHHFRHHSRPDHTDMMDPEDLERIHFLLLDPAAISVQSFFPLHGESE